MRCEKHDWNWDISDPTGCPICYGERLAEERIIKLLEEECAGDWPKVIEMHLDVLIALIKGENTCKHERTLDWGQHCDCGTRHRDCLDCDWTEPCKPEGENK